MPFPSPKGRMPPGGEGVCCGLVGCCPKQRLAWSFGAPPDRATCGRNRAQSAKTRGFFTPRCIPWGEKGTTWAFEPSPPSCSSSPAAAPALPGEITPRDLAPSTLLYPADEKQPNAIQPVPTSSCFQQKSPRNLRGGRAAAAPAAGAQMGASWPPAVPTAACHQPALPAVPSLAVQLPGHGTGQGSRWNKAVEKAKLPASAGGRFPPDS